MSMACTISTLSLHNIDVQLGFHLLYSVFSLIHAYNLEESSFTKLLIGDTQINYIGKTLAAVAEEKYKSFARIELIKKKFKNFFSFFIFLFFH